MNTSSDNMKRKTEITQRYHSPAYRQLCLYFQSEFDRLSSIAAGLQQHLNEFEKIRNKSTVRTEYALGSDLHRGFYCPSPVYELIIGNTHRGKIIKHLTVRSKPTHKYGFDSSNRLLWCDSLDEGNTIMREYLVYENGVVYGITFDWTDSVYLITEEIYQEEHLVQYTQCLCPSLDSSKQCVELRRENYTYDEEGLCSCEWHQYSNPSDSAPSFSDCSPPFVPHILMCDSSEYRFIRKKGYIESYIWNDRTYYPRIKKKA